MYVASFTFLILSVAFNTLSKLEAKTLYTGSLKVAVNSKVFSLVISKAGNFLKIETK